ncbi:MAG: 3-oxoadipyl-CoA thiolase [Acidobacteria bacterium]|nr:3-oxoadipyl-CoA thiolase [Acidobacteriota bacterium]
MTEAYICGAVRTPIGRFGGSLSSVRPDDLLAHVMKTMMDRHGSVDWDATDDVFIGAANQAGEDNRNVARMAVLLSGMSTDVPGSTINRLCGSGMEAIGLAARTAKAGEGHLFLAGGVESMSRAPKVLAKADAAFTRSVEMYDTTIGWRFVNQKLAEHFGRDEMPATAENVAVDYAISREDQDTFSLRSQERAAKATASGRLAREIVAVEVAGKKGAPTLVSEDEHPRPGITAERLAGLRPLFEGGTITAGNASGINDGAAATIVASDVGIQRHGLVPRARILGMATAGVPPRIMGIGPVPATRKVLDLVGLELSDMAVIELNEAFAAQALAVLRELGIPDDAEFVNPNGGAIALGHPLGMTGTRLVNTVVEELHLRDERYGLATMCIGVGQGIAMVLEKV